MNFIQSGVQRNQHQCDTPFKRFLMFGTTEHEKWMDLLPDKVLPFFPVDTKKIVEWKSALIVFIA